MAEGPVTEETATDGGGALRASRPFTWLVRARGYEYLLAPLLALAVLCAAFAVRGIYPFGQVSVAIWDMDIQYVGLFGWLSDVMHGQGSLFYSFSQGMGEGTAATVAYYLSSPFNLLAWFFQPEDAPQLMSWLTLLKLACAALTCYVFLRLRHRPGTVHVLLSAAYALCGYAVAECSNIMWLDGVIMLPLVALGTWRLVRRGTCLTLFLSVAAAVTFNWYTGYMDCVFSVLYFLVCWLDLAHDERHVRVGGRYALTMLLGVGASLALFLPAVLGLLATKEGGGSLLRNVAHLRFSYNPSNLLASFALTATPSSDWDRMAPLYTSALAVVLAVSFLLNRGVARRRRVLAAALLGFMAVSVCVAPLDVMWSGFKPATSYFFRYAYVVSFAVVLVAAQGWEALGGLEVRARLRALGVAAFLACLGIGLAVMNVKLYTRQSPVGIDVLLATFALLVGFALLVCAAVGPKRGRARVALGVMGALLAAEQGVNAASVFSHYARSVDDWGAYISELHLVYDQMERGDDGLRVAQTDFSFRGEGANHATTTEGFLMGASSLSEYTSTMGSPMVDLLTRLGYAGTNEIFGYYDNAPMTTTDALLGISYTISRAQPPLTEVVGSVNAPHPGYRLWRSTVNLPAAYGIAAGAGDVTWPEVSFDNQDAFSIEDVQDEWQGFSLVKDPFANQEAMLANMTGQDASGLYADAEVSELTDVATTDSRTWNVTIFQDGPTYLHVPIMSTLRQRCMVSVDGTDVRSVGNNFDNGVIYLGECTTGQVLQVTVRLTPDMTGSQTVNGTLAGGPDGVAEQILAGSSSSDLLVARTLNTSRFFELRGALDDDAARAESFEDGRVSLSFSADKGETLLTVIPYDTGWHVTIDGEPAEVRRLYEGLCGVDVSAGEHQIEFIYETPGLAAGAMASVSSVAAFAVWREVARRRRLRERI